MRRAANCAPRLEAKAANAGAAAIPVEMYRFAMLDALYPIAAVKSNSAVAFLGNW